MKTRHARRWARLLGLAALLAVAGGATFGVVASGGDGRHVVTAGPQGNRSLGASSIHASSHRRRHHKGSAHARRGALGDRTEVGAYAGPGERRSDDKWASRFGIAPAAGYDYLSDTSWTTIAHPSWIVSRWAKSQESMTFAVPMLPRHGASLAYGAAGRYDGEFSALADYLVSQHEEHATLVLGWSPLERHLPWSVTDAQQAASYVGYFRRIVQTMRSASGAHFSFAFEPGPAASAPPVPVSRLYPGRRYASVIAVALFDEIWPVPKAPETRWDAILRGTAGPAYAERLAERHSSRLIVTGLALAPASRHGAGDDPAFVRASLRFAERAQARALFVWERGRFAVSPARAPRSFALLKRVLSGSERRPRG